MHVSSFGMYGFAILSSADFRKTMSFCERYHVLSTPLVTLTFREEHGVGVWSVVPIVQTPVNDPLYRFIVEMQMGIILSLMRDVMGASFSPKEVALAFSRPDDFGLAEHFKECKIVFGRPVNEFIFDATWLNASARLGNRIQEACGSVRCGNGDTPTLSPWRSPIRTRGSPGACSPATAFMTPAFRFVQPEARRQNSAADAGGTRHLDSLAA